MLMSQFITLYVVYTFTKYCSYSSVENLSLLYMYMLEFQVVLYIPMYSFSHFTATTFSKYGCHIHKILHAKMTLFLLN